MGSKVSPNMQVANNSQMNNSYKVVHSHHSAMHDDNDNLLEGGEAENQDSLNEQSQQKPKAKSAKLGIA